MIPDIASRLARKLLLASGSRISPERLLKRSRRRAAGVAAEAARLSAAYRSLLQAHGIDPAGVGPDTDLSILPILTKVNTFERFGLAELMRPVTNRSLADVLTSSGRGGTSFGFKLTERSQHERSWFDIDLGLQEMFKVDQHPTLLVNCLPMGVAFRSRAVTVANVSVREDMACAILRSVGPHYAQTLLCIDPLFIRPVLAHARASGVDWKALNTSVIVGEEVLVEAQRDYIAAQMDIDMDRDTHRTVGSSFGVGELGLNLLFETRETIRMRRALRAREDMARVTSRNAAQIASAPSIFCFNPLRCHVEVLNPSDDGFGELCFTMLDRRAIILLPRYASGDLGRLMSRDEVAGAAASASVSVPWLPVVAVRGRIQDRPLGLPSVECVKELLYADHAVADQLSGAFRLAKEAHGGVRLTFQAVGEAGAADAALRERLEALARDAGIMPLAIDVQHASAESWGPALDYERKFAYVGRKNPA